MFCPVCGKELEINARFCPECGATIIGGTPTPYVKPPIQPATSSATAPIPVGAPRHSRTYHYHRSRRGLTVGLFIGFLLLAGGGIFGIVIATNWGNIEGYKYYYYENPTPASIEAFHFDVDVADVNIGYNSTPTPYLIEIEYHYRSSGAFLEGKGFEDLYEVNWENTSAIVYFQSHFKWWTNWIFNDRSVITITLRSDILYSIDGDVSTGKLLFSIPDNTTLSTVLLGGSTGDITLGIGNGTVFQENFTIGVSTGSIEIYGNDVEFQEKFITTASTGDIHVAGHDFRFKDDLYADVSTGSITFIFTNPQFGDRVELYASTGDIYVNLIEPEYNVAESTWIGDISTGSFTMMITQSTPMGTNVTATIGASTGDISIDVNLESSIGARFLSSVSTGSYSYSNAGGFETLGSVFQTITFPRTSNYYFTLDVTTGDIDVSGLSN